MKINPNSWHCKLYRWVTPIWFYFKTGCSIVPSAFSERSNLCFYIRMLLVWFPLLIFCYAALLFAAIVALFLLPWKMFGFGYPIFWLIVALVVGLVFGISQLRIPQLRRASDQPKFYRIEPHKIINAYEKQKKYEESFTRVAIEWIKSQKAKICPIIEFGE